MSDGRREDLECECPGGTHEPSCCQCGSTGHCCVGHPGELVYVYPPTGDGYRRRVRFTRNADRAGWDAVTEESYEGSRWRWTPDGVANIVDGFVPDALVGMLAGVLVDQGGHLVTPSGAVVRR